MRDNDNTAHDWRSAEQDLPDVWWQNAEGEKKRHADGLVIKIREKHHNKLTWGGFNILSLHIDHSKQLSAVSIKTRPLLPLSFPPLLPPPFHIVCVH